MTFFQQTQFDSPCTPRRTRAVYDFNEENQREKNLKQGTLKETPSPEHVSTDAFDIVMESTQGRTSIENISLPSASPKHCEILSRNEEESTSAATSTFLHAIAEDFDTIEDHLSIRNTSDEVRYLNKKILFEY